MFPKDQPQPLTVSQFTERLRGDLSSRYANVLVTGEITGLTAAGSGHLYFSLKDEAARLAAVIWRGTAAGLKFRVEEGMQVVCRGSVDVYPPRGVYQLVVRTIQPVGVGPLELAFQQLHRRLMAEGLFAKGRKRPIPTFPRRVAVVTSPQGAAIRDFVEVLGRRWPSVELVVVPTRVQGEGSAAEIAAAIRLANRVRPAFDVLVVCRGGGSLEDLWAFNEEAVCRAVFESGVPVVSGVGHETDLTLCDLTADLRALTPSEAAERIVPDRGEILAALKQARNRMATSLQQRLRTMQQMVDMLGSRPALARPLERFARLEQELREQALRLQRPMERRIEGLRHQTSELAARLRSLSPLAVLDRGYSITSTSDGRVLRSATGLRPGDRLQTRLADGEIISKVESAHPLAAHDKD